MLWKGRLASWRYRPPHRKWRALQPSLARHAEGRTRSHDRNSCGHDHPRNGLPPTIPLFLARLLLQRPIFTTSLVSASLPARRAVYLRDQLHIHECNRHGGKLAYWHLHKAFASISSGSARNAASLGSEEVD